jgi:hypothetical protein
MPDLHNHTQHFPSFRDCQAVPAKTQTQAWQKVCLSQRSNKATNKQADEKAHRSDNSRNRFTTPFSKQKIVVSQKNAPIKSLFRVLIFDHCFF